jgi:hypothetical protein
MDIALHIPEWALGVLGTIVLIVVGCFGYAILGLVAMGGGFRRKR